ATAPRRRRRAPRPEPPEATLRADAELEDVGTVVVAGDVEGHRLFRDARQVEIGDDDLLPIEDRSGDEASVRAVDRGAAVVEKTIRGPTHVGGRLHLARQVARPENLPDGENEAAPFEGIVPARHL